MRFYFPRGAVQPEDKELSFRFEIQDTIVEAKFKIKDMQYKGKIALCGCRRSSTPTPGTNLAEFPTNQIAIRIVYEGK